MCRLTSLCLYLPLSFVWYVDLQSQVWMQKGVSMWIILNTLQSWWCFFMFLQKKKSTRTRTPGFLTTWSFPSALCGPSSLTSLVTGRTWGTALQSFGNLIPFAGRSSMEGGMVISRLCLWIQRSSKIPKSKKQRFDNLFRFNKFLNLEFFCIFLWCLVYKKNTFRF